MVGAWLASRATRPLPATRFRAWRRPISRGAECSKVRHGDPGLRRTGSEVEIKSTVNLDQGRAYFPLSVQRRRADTNCKRAEHWEPMTVPRGVRFLVATVDVQAGTKPRFVVQVTGFGVGLNGGLLTGTRDQTERVDRNNPPALLPLDPSSYVEDWRRLIERRSPAIPLADGSGARCRCV